MDHTHAMSENGGNSSRERRQAIQKRLGRGIRSRRCQKGWNQEDLALRMEVSRHLVGKWELGTHAPPLTELMRLLEVLEVTLEELVLGNGAARLKLSTEQRSEAASCLNAFLQVIRPWLRPPAGSAAVVLDILPAQRNDAAMCLNAFLRVIRPWLEPPSAKGRKRNEPSAPIEAPGYQEGGAV